MKVLHTITDLNLSSGGAATATKRLYVALKEQGINNSLLTLSPNKRGDKIIITDSQITVIPFDGKTQFVYSRGYKEFLNNNTHFDIYHANGIWTYPTYKTIKVATLLNKPTVVTMHGMLNHNALNFSAIPKKIFLSIFQRKELNRVSCIHATSRYEAQCIRDARVIAPIAVIPNGIEIKERVAPQKDISSHITFGFIGRVDRVKNLHLLLKVWRDIENIQKNIRLVIIGDGDKEYLKELLNFVCNNNITSVEFKGMLSEDNTQLEIEKLNYLILPSISENFGMVVVEALSKGIPVIATKGTPWQDLEDCNCGWWIENNYNTLKATINAAIATEQAEYTVMSNHAKELAQSRYSIDYTAEKMHQLYNYLINKNNKPNFIID